MAYNIINFKIRTNDNTPVQLCNMCGKTLEDCEGIKLYHQFSYGSKRDMSKLHADLCVKCMDILVDDLVTKCKVVDPIVV